MPMFLALNIWMTVSRRIADEWRWPATAAPTAVGGAKAPQTIA